MRKILVIDDEEWLREMVHLALTQRGFEVIEAESGSAGIETARRVLPDLILCDVNMQKVDGYLTLSSLRSEPATASIPFILMTGLADNAGMRHGMELGADDYLPKPFTIDALYAAVETRLKKAHMVRQEAERKLAELRDNVTLMLPHELKTPLNGIVAYGELLASEAGTLPVTEVAEMGQVICESGKRLEKLVENFLIYAQIEITAADPQKVNALRQKRTPSAADFIAERARNQAKTAGRSNDLKLNLIDRPLPISEEYLGKLVDELIHNAFKFSLPGTPVEISLDDAQQANLTVSDRGRGFSTEHITKVGAYMQFDRKIHEQQGQGLGLSIAKRLAELHGGSLSIQSERNAGSSIEIKFPRMAVSEHAVTAPGSYSVPAISASSSNRQLAAASAA